MNARHNHVAKAEAVPVQTRHAIEDEIERLIGLLDLMDPDPDLEPWLAGRGEVVGANDREGDTSDDEPSLGWTAATNQTLALEGGANPYFLDGEQDAGDEPELLNYE